MSHLNYEQRKEVEVVRSRTLDVRRIHKYGDLMTEISSLDSHICSSICAVIDSESVRSPVANGFIQIPERCIAALKISPEPFAADHIAVCKV